MTENNINQIIDNANTDNKKENIASKLKQAKGGFGRIKKYINVFWEFLKVIIIAAVIVLPIRYFLFQPFIVKGESMMPNFQSGDYLIIDEVSYRISNPKRGDVVVLKYPLDTSQRFIKRIIGLPGETVEVNNGKITISKEGESLILDKKKYLSNIKGTEGNLRIVLPDSEYFVLGDNRQFSYDSRGWGVLPKKDIVGKVIFRVFPISSFSYISRN